MSFQTQGAESRALFQWVSELLDTIVTDASDFKSGILLIRLVEHLFNEKLKPTTYRLEPKREIDMVINNDSAINFLKSKDVKIVNLSGRDIVEGKVNAVLSALTTVFFKCPRVGFDESSAGRGDPLLKWVQSTLAPAGVTVTNWTSSWSDGRAIYALVATALPTELTLGDCGSLSAADRESRAIIACQSRRIPIHVSVGDIISVQQGSIIVKIAVQEIYAYVKNPRPRQSLNPNQSLNQSPSENQNQNQSRSLDQSPNPL
jgi:hypothetical protein